MRSGREAAAIFRDTILRGCKGFDGIHGLVPIHKWLCHYVNDGQGLDSLDPGPSAVAILGGCKGFDGIHKG